MGRKLFVYATATLMFLASFAVIINAQGYEGEGTFSNPSNEDIGDYSFVIGDFALCTGFATGVTGITDVNIPDTISYNDITWEVLGINIGAFQGKGLTSITVGANIVEIGANAFESNPNVESIVFNGKPCELGDNSFDVLSGSATTVTETTVSSINNWAENVFTAKVTGSSANHFAFSSSEPNFIDVSTEDGYFNCCPSNAKWNADGSTAVLELNGVDIKSIKVESTKPLEIKLNGKNCLNGVVRNSAVYLDCTEDMTITGSSLDINLPASDIDQYRGICVAYDYLSNGSDAKILTIDNAEIGIKFDSGTQERFVKDYTGIECNSSSLEIKNSTVSMSNLLWGINISDTVYHFKIEKSNLIFDIPFSADEPYEFIYCGGGVILDREFVSEYGVTYQDENGEETTWDGDVHLVLTNGHTEMNGKTADKPSDLPMQIAVVACALVAVFCFGYAMFARNKP